LILPDVRGLHPFYRDLAMRSAEAGMHAVAIDYFGRTAGLGERNEDFDHMTHVRQTTPDGVARDVAAAMERLRSETAATRLYTMLRGAPGCVRRRVAADPRVRRDHGERLRSP
jgi:carboxymethylenebutenolidase